LLEVKRFLDRVIDSYDSRMEKREELFERTLAGNVDALSDRRTLKITVATLGGVNLLLWACVVLVPRDLIRAFEKVGSISDKVVLAVIAIVFGIGLWLTYSLFRLEFPDLESRSADNEPMSSFADQENSTRKIRVWILSVTGGVLNLLALAIVLGLLVS
jgi:hypothetical protein